MGIESMDFLEHIGLGLVSSLDVLIQTALPIVIMGVGVLKFALLGKNLLLCF